MVPRDDVSFLFLGSQLSPEQRKEMNQAHETDNPAARPWLSLLAEIPDTVDRQHFVTIVLLHAERASSRRETLVPHTIRNTFFTVVREPGDRQRLEDLCEEFEGLFNDHQTHDLAMSQIRAAGRELDALRSSVVVVHNGSEVSSLSSSSNIGAANGRNRAPAAQEPLPAAQYGPVLDLAALDGNNSDSSSDDSSTGAVRVPLEDDSVPRLNGH